MSLYRVKLLYVCELFKEIYFIRSDYGVGGGLVNEVFNLFWYWLDIKWFLKREVFIFNRFNDYKVKIYWRSGWNVLMIVIFLLFFFIFYYDLMKF